MDSNKVEELTQKLMNSVFKRYKWGMYGEDLEQEIRCYIWENRNKGERICVYGAIWHGRGKIDEWESQRCLGSGKRSCRDERGRRLREGEYIEPEDVDSVEIVGEDSTWDAVFLNSVLRNNSTLRMLYMGYSGIIWVKKISK